MYCFLTCKKDGWWMPVVCIGFYCIQPTIKFYTHGQQILATYAPVNTDWIIGLDWITGSQSLSLQKTMCSMQLPLLFLQFSFLSLKKKVEISWLHVQRQYTVNFLLEEGCFSSLGNPTWVCFYSGLWNS